MTKQHLHAMSQLASEPVSKGQRKALFWALENEAPFPEALAAFFVQGYCPSAGTVLDPFSGSGTTVCEAVRFGRNGIGIDLRASQAELGHRRLARRIAEGRAPIGVNLQMLMDGRVALAPCWTEQQRMFNGH